jgi:steroid delta-isomerase-like uncharacterized protein
MMRAMLVAVITLFASITACVEEQVDQGEQPPEEAAAEAPRREVLEAYVAAWNAQDLAAIDSLVAPEGVHEDIAAGIRVQGPAQVKEFIQMVIGTQPDYEWRLTEVYEAGPVIVAEWTWTSTFTGPSPSGPVTNRPISGRGASIVEIESGRITRITDYFDLASFFREDTTGSAGQPEEP